MERRVVFPGRVFPILLLAPQLAVTLVFFFCLFPLFLFSSR